MSRKKVTPALAYFRTSSATNVGPDRDSEKRQHEAVAAFARRAGYEIEAEFYDAAVSGADPVDARPGFAALLARIALQEAKVCRLVRDLSVRYEVWVGSFGVERLQRLPDLYDAACRG